MSATGNEREASPARNESEWRQESGRGMGSFPRGIEVLVKKASVDAAFRERLFAQRGGAAAAIDLELDPAEAAMLSAIPHDQLTQIITHTTVPLQHRRVFLGQVAAAMLAALGVGLAGCKPAKSRGIQPDRPDRRLNPPAGNAAEPVSDEMAGG